MVWNTRVNLDDVIGSSNTNDLIRVVEGISSNIYGHSANTTKHYPSSQLKLNYYKSSMGYGHSSNTSKHYPSSQLKSNFYRSSMGYGLSSNYNSHKGNANAHHAQVHDINTHNWANDWMIIYSNGTGLQELTFNDQPGKFLKSQGEAALIWGTAYSSEANLTNVLYDNYYPSSTGRTLNLSYSGHSSNTTVHYPSSQLKLNYYKSSMGYGHSSNTSKHYPSSQLKVNYYKSSMGNGISGTLNSHKGDSTIHFTQGNIIAVGTVTTGTIRQGVLASGLQYYQGYLFSSNAPNLYYKSSNGNTLNNSYINHSSNTSKHYPSSQLKANFYLSSMGYGHSSNTGKHYPSSQLKQNYYKSSMGYGISGTLNSHKADSTIHFTQSNITTVGTVTTGTIRQGALASGSQYYSGYGHSGNTSVHLSAIDKTDLTDGGQTILHKHKISSSVDILNFNSTNFTNSGLKWNGTYWVSSQLGGGGGTPGGSSGQIQYNKNSTFGGDSNLTWAAGVKTLRVIGGLFSSQRISSNSISAYGTISANTFQTDNLILNANTISGLIDPVYPSAASNKHYVDKMLPLTFSVANIRLSANQNINMARFRTPTGKKCYVWQAGAATSGGISKSKLYVDFLSGSTSIYKTSSNTIQIGSPLAQSSGSIEIRFMYSGTSLSGYAYGSGFMNVSVY